MFALGFDIFFFFWGGFSGESMTYAEGCKGLDPLQSSSVTNPIQPYLSGGAEWKNLPDFSWFFPVFPDFSLFFSYFFPHFLSLFPDYWQFFRRQGGTLSP